MPSKLKLYMSNEYSAKFKDVKSMLFFDYQKISANDWYNLKAKLQEENISVMVIRNRVFNKTMEQCGISGLSDILIGPISVAFGADEGAVIKAAKIMLKHFKSTETGEIKGGMLDGVVDDAEAAKKYKDLLTREETLSVLSGQILAVGAGLASQLISPAGALASQIEQKGEGEDEKPEDKPEDKPEEKPAE